jgi:hypothetical protein
MLVAKSAFVNTNVPVDRVWREKQSVCNPVSCFALLFLFDTAHPCHCMLLNLSFKAGLNPSLSAPLSQRQALSAGYCTELFGLRSPSGARVEHSNASEKCLISCDGIGHAILM